MTPVPAPIAAVPAAPAADVKSGWKTSEMWITTVLLGMLATGAEQLITMIPKIMETPGIPPWAAMVGPLAVAALGWTAKLLVVKYNAHRLALKLPVPDVTSAVAAGAAAANETNDRVLAALNK